jgi:hypothetical protein
MSRLKGNLRGNRGNGSGVSTDTTHCICSTRPPCVGSIEAFLRAILKPGPGGHLKLPVGPVDIAHRDGYDAGFRLKKDLRTLFAELGPFIIEGSGRLCLHVSLMAHMSHLGVGLLHRGC